MEQKTKSSEKEFTVVECTGHDGSGEFAPEKIYIERILEPHLLKSGQKVVYFTHIEKVSTLVGIRGHKSAPTSIDKAISDFCKLPEEKWDKLGKIEGLKYAGLRLAGGVDVIASMDSTEQDKNIFANFVAKRQLDGLVPKLNEVTERFRNFGKKFQSF